MTVDEFWVYANRPENELRNIDLIRGEIVEAPRPDRKHGVVCVRIGCILENWITAGQVGYMTLGNAGVVLERNPDTVVGPDVAYYTDVSRFEDLPPKWGDVPPILAVEVAASQDLVQAKIAAYLRVGVGLVWFVDCIERSVTVFRPHKHTITLRGPATVTVEEVLPGFRCTVSDFFQLHRETAPSSLPSA